MLIAFCISSIQSPLSMMGSPIPCLGDIFFLHLLTAWNRLVPVAIAAFRYIMVCHAVFVQNHGGEKMVGSLSWYLCKICWPILCMAAIIKNPNPQGVEVLDFHSIFVECRRLHSDQLPPRASAQLPLLHGKAGTLQVTFLHLYDCHVYKKRYLVFIVQSSPWTNSLSRYDTSDFFGSYHNGLELQGPLWDPIRICANLLSLNSFVVVPIFYCAIFKFRRAQDLVPGIRAMNMYTMIMAGSVILRH